MPRTTSTVARVDGVVTTTAPWSGAFAAMACAMPPVPGGLSTMRKSNSPHAVVCSNLVASRPG
eukprot:6749601-Prymnesium_polylepis.1